MLLDAGANAECQPSWLVQFAQMGAAYFTERYGTEEPRVGLLSIGEEPTKGTPLVKEAHGLMAAGDGSRSGGRFVGNIEGRDLMTDQIDVVVTDGFTGNIVLKTLEGAARSMREAVFTAMTSTEEGVKASEVMLPLLAPLATELDPDTYGGALLLGVDGVCIISHGSSSTSAVVNAVRVARDMVGHGLVDWVRQAVKA